MMVTTLGVIRLDEHEDLPDCRSCHGMVTVQIVS